MGQLLGGGRYELLDRIGYGGMATVYSARDLKLDRQVAIKLLADNFAGDREIRERFIREARLAAKLEHPNVVQVFDVGEEDERSYIVMERVRGGTLGDRIGSRHRAPDRDEALRLLCQMCSGLGHAHQKKLVHRDIKPQNLLLREPDHCLKVADFGIARAAEETTRLTRPGKVIGTDRYMAPEQLADGKITPATDVYACGVVADQLLPSARSPELREIVERCLQEDPGERFEDATALGEAFASVDGNGDGAVMRRVQAGAPTRPLTARTAAKTRTDRERATIPLLGRAPPSQRPGTSRGRRFAPRPAAALLLAVIAIGGIVIAVDGEGSGTPTKAKSPSPTPVSPAPVPESSDPATQARELADYLRAQSRPPR